MLVDFEGGPWDGDVVDGIMARLLVMHEPPYVCVLADGRYEHYVAEDADHFVHAGICRVIEHVPSCGHDHSG